MAPALKKAKRAKKAARPKIRKLRPASRADRSISSVIKRKARAKRPPSSLELKVYAMLDEEGIQYIKEKSISRVKVDIFIGPRYVVELQGCYWHGCKSCTKELSKDQLKWRVKDERRHFILRKLRYHVVEIWEHEVEKDPERVRKLLKAMAGKKE